MSTTIVSNNVSAQTNETAQVVSTRLTPKQTQTKPRFIFILMLHSGKFVIGSATNAATRIAAINGGMNSAVPKSLQVNRVIGVKPVNDTRTLPSVVASYCERFGEERIICV